MCERGMGNGEWAIRIEAAKGEPMSVDIPSQYLPYVHEAVASEDSVAAADRLVDQLLKTFLQLAEGLMTGERFVDSRKRESHRISQGNYVIYHRRVGRVTEI